MGVPAAEAEAVLLLAAQVLLVKDLMAELTVVLDMLEAVVADLVKKVKMLIQQLQEVPDLILVNMLVLI